MQNTNTTNQSLNVKNFLERIPKDLLVSFSEIAWQESFNAIKQKFNLTEEETDAVSLETFMFIFGLTNPLDFPNNIENSLNENKLKSKDIQIEIENKILKLIYEKTQKKGIESKNEEKINITKEDLLQNIEDLEIDDILFFEAYQNAPQKIKDFFIGDELPKKIQKIGEKFILKEEEKSIIEAILTVNILSGISNQKIRNDLKEKLTDRQNQTNEIATELEKEIIFPLINSLDENTKIFEKKIEEIKVPEEEEKMGNKDVRLPEKLKQKFYDLPQDLRWAIGDIKVEEKMLELKQKYNLNIEQAGFVSSEIYGVLVGYTHPEEFAQRTKMILKAKEEDKNAIINFVNENIFGGVREKLLSLHKEKDKKEIIIDDNNKSFTPTEESGKNLFNKLKEQIDRNKIIHGLPTEEKSQEEVIKKENTNTPNFSNSIFAQKLTNNVKMAQKETEHSINKDEIPDTLNQKTIIKKTDPYREIPE